MVWDCWHRSACLPFSTPFPWLQPLPGTYTAHTQPPPAPSPLPLRSPPPVCRLQAALSMLASNGVSTPPLIGIGSTAQQALDIRLALEAALATPGDGRCVIAVASAGACQQLLGECLGPEADQPLEEGGTASVGACFEMSPGGITIVNWPMGLRELGRGTVLCANYQLPPGAGAA